MIGGNEHRVFIFDTPAGDKVLNRYLPTRAPERSVLRNEKCIDGRLANVRVRRNREFDVLIQLRHKGARNEEEYQHQEHDVYERDRAFCLFSLSELRHAHDRSPNKCDIADVGFFHLVERRDEVLNESLFPRDDNYGFRLYVRDGL